MKAQNIASSHEIFYEPELFPAILISKWKPAHVTVFANGKGMITGVVYKKAALDILSQVCDFLTLRHDLH